MRLPAASHSLHSSRFGAPNGLPGLFKFLAVPNIISRGSEAVGIWERPDFLGENGAMTRN